MAAFGIGEGGLERAYSLSNPPLWGWWEVVGYWDRAFHQAKSLFPDDTSAFFGPFGWIEVH